MSRSCNKDGGAHMKQVDRMTKAATKPARGTHQKRGSSKSEAVAKHAKPQRNPSKDMEF